MVQSRSFVHFMDGYLHDDIMNFDLCNSILFDRGILKKRYKAPNVTLKTFTDQIEKRLRNMSGVQIQNYKDKFLEQYTQSCLFTDQ